MNKPSPLLVMRPSTCSLIASRRLLRMPVPSLDERREGTQGTVEVALRRALRRNLRAKGERMETILDDKLFTDAQELINLLNEWLTNSQEKYAARLEFGDGTRLSRAVFLATTLSDGSVVYDVRLS